MLYSCFLALIYVGPSCSPHSRHCVSAGSKLVSQVVELDMVSFWDCQQLLQKLHAGSSGMCSTKSCTLILCWPTFTDLTFLQK